MHLVCWMEYVGGLGSHKELHNEQNINICPSSLLSYYDPKLCLPMSLPDGP